MRVTNGVLNLRHWPFAPFDAGWSSPVARQAHNLKAAGSNPAPATKSSPLDQGARLHLARFVALRTCRAGMFPASLSRWSEGYDLPEQFQRLAFHSCRRHGRDARFPYGRSEDAPRLL